MTTTEAKEEVARRLEKESAGNRPVAKRQVNFRLRDWGISRQRYWGCPIPVIHCQTCGIVPVPEQDLPVTLPDDVTFDRPGNPLDRHPTWKHVRCPQCGADATRETDTMDTFVDSSWYFERFTDPWITTAPTDRPMVERDLLIEDTITLPVQINGKKRADVTIARNAPQAEIEATVLALDAVKKALDGKAPKKVIIVPQRIVNVVA
jgi:leucyl-tRNA synthetase